MFSDLLLYGFRVYLLYMVHTFEADFVLKSRVINNGTQIELVGFNRASCRQLFRICLSAEDSNRLVGMLVEGGDATLLSEME